MPRGTRRWPSRRSTTSARPSRSSSPATGYRPRTRSSSSTSTTSRCRRCSTWRRRSPRAPHLLPRRPRHERELPLRLRRRRGRHGRRHRRRPSPTPTIVVSRRFVQQRLIPAFMEPRSVVVEPHGEQLHDVVVDPDPAHPAGDAGAGHRHPRAQAAGHRPGRRRRLRRQAAGHPEEILALAGRRAGWAGRSSGPRPAASRCMAAHHGRDQIQDIEIAADRDGNITGLKVDLLADMGAYLRLVTPGIPLLGAFMFNGIYKLDAYRFDCTGVFTTKTPTDAYRGAGRPEATFAIERIMDELAAELGMDPLELRQQNWIKHEEFPYTTIAGLTYDSGNYEAATAKAMELFGYDELRARAAASGASRKRPGPAGHRHLDLHRDVRAGPVPGARLAVATAPAAGSTRRSGCCPPARSRWSPASSPHGQGHETAWSQIVADQLGVPFEDIEVLHGDTADLARTAWTPTAPGRWPSAASPWSRPREKVVAKARTIAAHMLEAVRGRPGVRRRRVPGQGRPGHGQDHPGGRAGHVRRARPARRRRADARRRRHRTTRRTSPSRTARTCARSRSTPRPGMVEDPQVRLRRRRRQRASTR